MAGKATSGSRRPSERAEGTYGGATATAAEILSSGDQAAMAALAGDRESAPEVLFVLSQASSGSIRARVAANPATPEHADALLVEDADPTVRAELGRKITRLLPELSEAAAARLQAAAAAKLTILARDCEAAVRRALAAEICRLDCAPRDVITTLVRDLDELVAVPVAEFSPVLTDDDLIALIGESPSAATLAAVARRDEVSPEVSDCLVATRNVGVIAALLRNTTAFIRETTLDWLVRRAHEFESWHEPLVARQELTERMVEKLSGFVADDLVTRLVAKSDLSPDLRARLRERIEAQPARRSATPGRSEADLISAIERRSEGVVVTALAMRAGLAAQDVQRVFATRLPQAVIALAWKAGLSMEVAAKLQAFPGRIPEARRIAMPADGSAPLKPEELDWQIASLGLGGAASATD